MRIQVKAAMTDAEADALAGTKLDDKSYDQVIDFDCEVVREDGSILAILKKNVIPRELCDTAFVCLKDAAQPTTNRGTATGKGTMRNRPLKDGGVSKTREVPRHLAPHSGIVGYFDRYQRTPYCRQTAYALDNQHKFQAAVPFIQAVDKVFADYLPSRYAVQKAMVDQTHPDWVINKTAFTTMTVNLNWQTAVHQDAGDLKEGFGVMTVYRQGSYEGGLFVFPKYRIAFNVKTGDVLLDDVHEWHGNTPLIGTPGTYNRMSIIFYYRGKMFKCESKEKELERAKHRKAGDSLYDEAEMLKETVNVINGGGGS